VPVHHRPEPAGSSSASGDSLGRFLVDEV